MKLSERIDHANAEAARRLTASRPRWVDVRPLRDVVLDLGPYEIAHAGPPLLLREMGAAMRDAVAAAALFEGWASTPAEAEGMIDRAELTLRPSQHAGGASAGAGVASARTPVFVVEERAPGDRQGALAWAALDLPELFAGADALARRWQWRDEWAPRLARAVASAGGVDVGEVIARALHEGDELSQRTRAATARAAAALRGRGDLDEVPGPLTAGEGFFAALALAAAKLACDGVGPVEDSTLVTAMGRNGARCGVRLAATGDRWFTADAPTTKGRLRDGFTEADAGRDVGDAVAEAAGLGAFALAAAPALLSRYGARGADAARAVRDAGEITVARHPRYTLPAPELAGVPAGIDARRVLDTGILPVVGASVFHGQPGGGVVGAGLGRVPLECFTAAIEAFAEARGVR